MLTDDKEICLNGMILIQRENLHPSRRFDTECFQKAETIRV